MNKENYDSFFARITPWMAPSDIQNIQIAYLLAKSGHRYQKRNEIDDNGQPIRYFEHVRQVALYAIDELECKDANTIIVALLHDSLEDTKRITEQMIEHLFGKEVVSDVKLLSKLPKEGYYERLIKFGNNRVWFLKLIDRICNLREMNNATQAFIDKQVKETKEKILPIFDNIHISTENSKIYLKLRENIQLCLDGLENKNNG